MGVICCKPTASSRNSIRDNYDKDPEYILKSKKRLQKEWQELGSHSGKFDLESKWRSGVSSEDIRTIYEFKKDLGEGYCGVVRKAFMKKFPEKQFAIKSIVKSSLSSAAWEHIIREIEILREVDCLHIVQFFEVYEDQKEIHIVMEICEGGDLVTCVEKNCGLNEALAKKLFWQACTAVNYLHHFGIMHRDIKLDNFLLTKKEIRETDMKLIDFGFATRFKDQRFSSTKGTPYYVAPEVLERNYSYECDVWSLGVLLYMMVFADPPFKGKTHQLIFEQIRFKPVEFRSDIAKAGSEPLKKLITSILVKDVQKRLKIHEILQDEWFHSTILDFSNKWKSALTKELLTTLKSTTLHTRFQAEIVKTMIKMFYDHPEIVKRKKIFTLIDYLNNGVLTSIELKQCYAEIGVPLSEEECKNMITNMYLRAKNVVTFTEFAAASLDKSFFLDDRHLRPIFDRMDVDSSGSITAANIRSSFERAGYFLDSETVQEFLNEFDKLHDKKISYEEFKDSMTKQ